MGPKEGRRMDKAQRDRMMTDMTPEERAEYRRVLGEVAAAAKATGGRQIEGRRRALASISYPIGAKALAAIKATAKRDQTGPREGEEPPDFQLKRLGSGELVRLSSFKGRRPVALIFGSYT